MNLGRHAAALCTALALATGGCTSSTPDESFRPSLEWTECPADVEATFLSRHECGYLTVLEDRSAPEGRTIALAVVRVWPVGVEPQPGISTGFGANIGDPVGLTGDIASGATRLERVVVQMVSRGAGPHAEPSLRCPEVDALGEQAAASGTGDEALTAAFVEAVGACADRLRAGDVDPAQYDVAAAAADVEDLRAALEIDQWYTVGSQGTESRELFEYLRVYPGRAQFAFVDSPWFPEIDDLTGGVNGARSALDELFAACADDAQCARSYPDLEQTWASALQRLDTTPLTGVHETRTGDPIAVTVDAGKLLRMARFSLGDGGQGNLRQLPEMFAAAARGELTPQLASLVANDPVFCAGYRPLCAGQDGFSLGVYLTTFCRDQMPFIDQAALAAAVAEDPVYEAVFADSPYLSACEAWDVPPGDPDTSTPVDTDVPLLMLPGQFDSYSPPSLAREQAQALDMAWVLEVPGQTHNTLGYAECAITARNAWALDPMSPPDDDACASAPALSFELAAENPA